METNCFNLPVSFIRQFCFCRRIPYLQIGVGINPPKAGWVSKGIDMHLEIDRLMQRRNLSRLGIDGEYDLMQEVSLCSEKLKMHGVCDGYVQSKDGRIIIPFEIKSNVNASLGRGEVLQLCAYSMLLEEKLGVFINVGMLLYGKRSKLVKVIISPELRNQVLNIVKKIEEDICVGIMPDTDATEAKCAQCEFFNFCADRF